MVGFLLVATISVLTTAAAVVLVRFGRGGATTSAIAPGLAAGVMLWIALVEVAPASVDSLGVAGLGAMAAGAVAVWIAARLAHRSAVAAGIAPVLGIALVLHDVPEGFAVGAALGGAGLAVSLPLLVAVTAHNLPEKLAFVAPVGAVGRPSAAVLAAATLPEPLGAALAGLGSTAAPGVVDAAVAVAGGMMAAVAVGALPAIAHRASAWRPFLGAGVAGAASVALVGVVLPA